MEGGGGFFEMLGRPKAKKKFFRIFIIFVYCAILNLAPICTKSVYETTVQDYFVMATDDDETSYSDRHRDKLFRKHNR